MRKTLLFIGLLCACVFNAKANKDKDSTEIALGKAMKFIDSVNKAMNYATGSVTLKDGIAKLNIPAGFKFLNETQSNYVLTELWGNPKQTGILGMIFPASSTPFGDSSYAFVVSYDDMGFVKDDDAKELNYDDMMKKMKEEDEESNAARVKEGYSAIHMIGWASKPFYDDKKKVLHWAKEIKFGDAEVNTLNYEVRVLGRKGVLSLNAVATMQELSIVKADIDKVLNMAEFTDGNRYADFSESNGDKIAVYTIGGLVAGKVLAKVGFWLLVAKFWKLIIGGLVAAWYAVKRFFLGRKEEPVTYAEEVKEPAELPAADDDAPAAEEKNV